MIDRGKKYQRPLFTNCALSETPANDLLRAYKKCIIFLVLDAHLRPIRKPRCPFDLSRTMDVF